jgi:hypothetical protein
LEPLERRDRTACKRIDARLNKKPNDGMEDIKTLLESFRIRARARA